MVAEVVEAGRPTQTLLPAAAPDARLPINYIEARAALARCDNLDEVAYWADKAAAIIAYAIQAKDTSLEWRRSTRSSALPDREGARITFGPRDLPRDRQAHSAATVTPLAFTDPSFAEGAAASFRRSERAESARMSRPPARSAVSFSTRRPAPER
jgi:hypothetical protein